MRIPNHSNCRCAATMVSAAPCGFKVGDRVTFIDPGMSHLTGEVMSPTNERGFVNVCWSETCASYIKASMLRPAAITPVAPAAALWSFKVGDKVVYADGVMPYWTGRVESLPDVDEHVNVLWTHRDNGAICVTSPVAGDLQLVCGFRVGDKVKHIEATASQWTGVVTSPTDEQGFVGVCWSNGGTTTCATRPKASSLRPAASSTPNTPVVPSTNQGLDACAACGQPTQAIMGFSEAYHVCRNATCSMCGK